MLIEMTQRQQNLMQQLKGIIEELNEEVLYDPNFKKRIDSLHIFSNSLNQASNILSNGDEISMY